MIPYLLILFCASLLFILGDRIKYKWPWYAFLILLIAFAGFRDMIGGYDIYIYSNVYEVDYKLVLLYTGFEEGFRVFVVLLKLISDKREFFIFAVALIMLVLHFKVIKKNSNLPYFAVFIYFCKFYLFSFVYLRQGIALGIIWLTIPMIPEKKYFKIMLLVIVAYFFHHSSLIYLPIVFLANRKFTNLQLCLSVVFFLIIFLSPIGQLITLLMGDITENSKLTKYASGESSFNIFTLIEMSGFVVLAIAFKKYFYQNESTVLVYNGFILYIVISIMGIPNATFARLAWYYFIFVVLAITYMFSFIADFKLRTAFKSLIFAYYTSVFLRLLIVFDGGDFMPYKTIFQDFPRNGMWEKMEYRKNKDF